MGSADVAVRGVLKGVLVEFLIIRCWQEGCPATFETLNDMQTHHLDAHERPLPMGAAFTYPSSRHVLEAGPETARNGTGASWPLPMGLHPRH